MWRYMKWRKAVKYWSERSNSRWHYRAQIYRVNTWLKSGWLSKNYRLVGGGRSASSKSNGRNSRYRRTYVDPYKTVIGVVKPLSLIAISIYLGSCPGSHRWDIRPRIRVQQTPSFVTCRRICRPNKRINGTRVNPIGRTALTLFVFFPSQLLRFISIRITVSLVYLYCCLISGSVPFHWSGTSTPITNNYFRLKL